MGFFLLMDVTKHITQFFNVSIFLFVHISSTEDGLKHQNLLDRFQYFEYFWSIRKLLSEGENLSLQQSRYTP